MYLGAIISLEDGRSSDEREELEQIQGYSARTTALQRTAVGNLDAVILIDGEKLERAIGR